MSHHRSSPSARPISAVCRREFLATSSAALLATNYRMNEEYITSVAEAIRKVARHYAA